MCFIKGTLFMMDCQPPNNEYMLPIYLRAQYVCPVSHTPWDIPVIYHKG